MVSCRRGERHRLADVRLDPYGVAIGADGDGPMFVRAQELDTQGVVALDDQRMGMTEPALPWHGKYGDAWVNGVYEGFRARGPAAMMGDFEDGGPKVITGLQQNTLGFLLDVPGE